MKDNTLDRQKKWFEEQIHSVRDEANDWDSEGLKQKRNTPGAYPRTNYPNDFFNQRMKQSLDTTKLFMRDMNLQDMHIRGYEREHVSLINQLKWQPEYDQFYNDVTLTVNTTTVDLGEYVTFSADIHTTTGIDSVSFEIIGVSHNNWLIMQSGTRRTHTRCLLSPGRWRTRVTVTFTDRIEIISNTVEIAVQYPHRDQIFDDVRIRAAMEDLWQHTKNTAKRGKLFKRASRQEFGFWIYAETRGGSLIFEQGKIDQGAVIYGGEGTHGKVIIERAREAKLTMNPITGGKFGVAHFHTHTPLTYCASGVREVGPSPDADVLVLESWGVPGFVYDYVGKDISKDMDKDPGREVMGIVAGHKIDDEAKVYHYGVDRHPTPNHGL